jgi:hypothetical protein
MRHAAAIVIALAACNGPGATTEAGSSTTVGTTAPTTGTPTTGEQTTGEPTTGEPGCGFAVTASAAWPEADALFKQNPRWLGADDAYSIALGGDRVLWLFADTFIATSDAHVRSESKLIHNSVGVQTGLDPASASIEFAWHEVDAPTSFFPEQADVWYWPGDGERVGDGLLIFLMAVHKVEGGFGFGVIGSDALWIADADAPPASWTPITVATFREPGRVPGSASVLVEGEFLYAFGDGDGGADLLRWPLAAVGPQPLPEPEVIASPALLATQVEFTVHHDPARSVYVHVQSEGFGGTDLAYRTAPALAGPWSGPTVFHRPAESDLEDAFVYAGKAHPELAGADLVATYVANSFEFADLFADPSLYYPRFVRVTLGCASG